jgi:hypothetical protein
MKTLAEIKAEILAENPSNESIINGEVIVLTDSEYDKAITDKAKMVLEQEKQLAELSTAKAVILEKLGITAEEAKLLLA